MTLKSITTATAPVVLGVVLAGALFYYMGNLPFLKQSASGFDGHQADNLIFD